MIIDRSIVGVFADHASSVPACQYIALLNELAQSAAEARTATGLPAMFLLSGRVQAVSP